jgi:hypothetical protein
MIPWRGRECCVMGGDRLITPPSVFRVKRPGRPPAIPLMRERENWLLSRYHRAAPPRVSRARARGPHTATASSQALPLGETAGVSDDRSRTPLQPFTPPAAGGGPCPFPVIRDQRALCLSRWKAASQTVKNAQSKAISERQIGSSRSLGRPITISSGTRYTAIGLSAHRSVRAGSTLRCTAAGPESNR